MHFRTIWLARLWIPWTHRLVVFVPRRQESDKNHCEQDDNCVDAIQVNDESTLLDVPIGL